MNGKHARQSRDAGTPKDDPDAGTTTSGPGRTRIPRWAAPDAGTPPAARPPRVTEQQRTFANCREAVDWLMSTVETGLADSQFTPRLGTVTPGTTADGGHTRTVAVSWTFDLGSSSTTIDVPSWPGMSEAERRAVHDYRDALVGHEEGHHRMARDFMAAAGTRITGEGATPEEALADLQRQVDEYKTATGSRLDEATAAYDEQTDHGRRQSAIGGRDVRLDCEPAQ
jgi:Bacterial protein of unknown function (DUF922)